MTGSSWVSEWRTILWLTGPRAIGEHIVPSIHEAAEKAGRSAPRVVASLPVCVTDAVDEAREVIGQVLAGYNDLPSYRAMMDREGAAGPADVAVIGTEDEVTERLHAFAAAGTTEFAAGEFGLTPDDGVRTRATLKALL